MVNVTKKTKKKPTESPEFVQLLKKMFFFMLQEGEQFL